MTLHSKRTRSEKQRRPQKVITHSQRYERNEANRNDQEFCRVTLTLMRALFAVINVCVRTRAHQSGHHFVEGGNNENCTRTHKHTLTDALIKITKRKAPFDSYTVVVTLTRLRSRFIFVCETNVKFSNQIR